MRLLRFVRRECASAVDAQAQEDRSYVPSKEEEVQTRARAGDVQLLASRTRKDARSRGVARATWHLSFEERCDDDGTTAAANGRTWMDFTCASMRFTSRGSRPSSTSAPRSASDKDDAYGAGSNSCDVLGRNGSDKETKAHEEDTTRGCRKMKVVGEEGDVHVPTMSAMGSRRRTRNDRCIMLSVQRNASSTEMKSGFVRGPCTRLLDAT